MSLFLPPHPYNYQPKEKNERRTHENRKYIILTTWRTSATQKIINMTTEHTTPAQEQAQQAQTTAQLTAEEYQTIKQILERIGCDGLIDCDEFFDTFFAFSFHKFFTNQSQIVAVLQKFSHEPTATNAERRAIEGYIEGLSNVNNVISAMVEGAHLFRQLDKFTGYLFDAYYDYEVNTKKIN